MIPVSIAVVNVAEVSFAIRGVLVVVLLSHAALTWEQAQI